MSKVSIIVPVYKAEQFIHRCVDSIINQSHQNFELILVDDGSPDNSGAICDDYAVRDSRVRVIHQKNAGCSAARNAGLELALQDESSHWIAFVDSDDWLHREYISLLLTAVGKTDTKLAICDCRWTSNYCPDEALEEIRIKSLPSEEAFVQYYPNCTPPWGKLIHKSLMRDLRFPLGIRYEDAYITHIITFSAGTVAVCPEKIYYYYNNENSYTRTAWSDGRLESIRVHEYRLHYFLEKSYQKAYCRELEEYVERITSHLSEISGLLESDRKYKMTFENLREKLRGAVREAETLGILHPDRQLIMTYAYVSRSNLLWKTVRGLQRIWRKVLNR